jgi:type IV secretory pathway TrbD component
VNAQPRMLAIHTSLIRPILLMGAERELVLISAILAAVLVMSLERLLFTIVGIVFWSIGLVALRRAAKADPQFSRVYLRHTRYPAYYAAQSRVAARLSTVRPGTPC